MSRHVRRKVRGKFALFSMAGVTIVLVLVAAWAALTTRANTPSAAIARPTPTPVKRIATATTVSMTPIHSVHRMRMISMVVRAYTIQGKMADGKQTHVGACAVSAAQFPLGTILKLYNEDGSFDRQCVAEDTGHGISNGEIDVAMPGDEAGAARWGVRHMLVEVVHTG